MNEYLNCKSSNNLRFKCSRKSFNLDASENLRDKKSLVDFISSKNKIILKSCFDHKGAKQFLSDKRKAMDKIVLEDEILDENLEKTKKKKSISKKSKSREKKNIRSVSHDTLDVPRKKKISDCLKIYPKVLSDKILPVRNIENKNNNNKGKLNLYIDKRRVVKLSSINSTFSNIQGKEPLNLVVNKNDSFIQSFINEMVKVKN
jgi:hypothetical protein